MDKPQLRDHREIGQEMDLFSVSNLVGGGLPLFTPKGTILRKTIHDFIETLQKDLGYQEVWIPHLAKPELYKLSGHLEKYPEYFRATSSMGDEFIIKPMDCPHHMEIFRSRQRSYKDLPIGYKEFTTNYRDEQSGELNGLLRVRSLTIDDCHIFCREEQIYEEAVRVNKTISDFYAAFNFGIRVRLSFRDPKNKDKYINNDKTWEKAESIIRKLAKEIPFETYEGIGEAAFYGPKIDFMIKDTLGREWQLATNQLDFLIPKRLGLEYVDSDGKKKSPVVIHRAIAGSLERFIGILLEHYQGNFPLWLSPVQAIVLPIADRHLEAANKINEQLKEAGIRSEVDGRSETLPAKIRDATLQKVPYMGIIGDKEIESSKLKVESLISVRTRKGEDLGQMEISKFVQKLKEEIDKKI